MPLPDALNDLLTDMDASRDRWVGSGLFVATTEEGIEHTYFASGVDGRWWSHSEEDGLLVHAEGRYWQATDPFRWEPVTVESDAGVYHDGTLLYFLQPSIRPILSRGPQDYVSSRRHRQEAVPVELLSADDDRAEILFQAPADAARQDYVLTYDRRHHIVLRMASTTTALEYAITELAPGDPPAWLFHQPAHHRSR